MAEDDPLADRPRDTWKYVYSLGGRMRWFFRVRGQVRMLITGDSRASSCDPMMFFREDGENYEYPIAYSLYTGGTGFDVHEIILTEYFPRAPNLEWVIYQMSPRIFNTYYDDTGIEALNASPGLKWDRDNAEALWGYLPDELITRADVPYSSPTLSQRYRQIRHWPQFCGNFLAELEKDILGPHRLIWERLTENARQAIRDTRNQASPARDTIEPVYDALNTIITGPLIYDEVVFADVEFPVEAMALIEKRDQLSDPERQRLNRYLIEAAFPREIQRQHPLHVAWGWTEWRYGGTNPDEIPRLLRLSSRGRFTLDEGRWERFLAILDYYEERDVKFMGYVSPMHYGLAQAACADDDGTLNSAYWALMHRLEDLAAERPNFFYIDLHLNGMNDLTDDDLFNWDHVNSFGAHKVTVQLEELRRSIDAQTLEERHRPRVTSATAVGEPNRVEITFSEPVDPATASDPARYIIEGFETEAVQLAGDMRSAVLETTPLAVGRDYALRLDGVMGASGLPLDESPSQFRHARALRLGSPQREGYSWDRLAVGANAYTDANTTISSAPEGFEGLHMLRTSDRDKGEGGDALISFDVNYPVRVYVAHDERIQMKPSWLDPSLWRYSWDFVNIAAPGHREQQLRILWRDFPAGKVRLGGNGGEDGNMYVVIVKPLGAISAPE